MAESGRSAVEPPAFASRRFTATFSTRTFSWRTDPWRATPANSAAWSTEEINLTLSLRTARRLHLLIDERQGATAWQPGGGHAAGGPGLALSAGVAAGSALPVDVSPGDALGIPTGRRF